MEDSSNDYGLIFFSLRADFASEWYAALPLSRLRP